MKKFALRTLLTVTSGRLLTCSENPNDNGIGNLYKLLSHMVGYDVFTHQLPRIGDECKPILEQRFPDLTKVNLETLDTELEAARQNAVGVQSMEKTDAALISGAINKWLLAEMDRLGLQASYEVEPLASPEAEKNPMEELCEMVGPDKVIGVIVE